MSVDEARRLAPRFAARAAGYDRDGSFPVEDFADLRAAGLFGLMVPARLGGSGAGFADYAAIAYELARGNGATALIFNMHASVTGALSSVTDELADALGLPAEALATRDAYLTAAARGAWYAVAMSERIAGSRLSQLTTSYERIPAGYRIRGAKTF
jgi:alkylation response protein AidB-like acyl-CoA dehydrogenase